MGVKLGTSRQPLTPSWHQNNEMMPSKDQTKSKLMVKGVSWVVETSLLWWFWISKIIWCTGFRRVIYFCSGRAELSQGPFGQFRSGKFSPKISILSCQVEKISSGLVKTYLSLIRAEPLFTVGHEYAFVGLDQVTTHLNKNILVL